MTAMPNTQPTARPPQPTSPIDMVAAVTTTKEARKTVDMSHSEKLSKECIGVRLNFNWFATSKMIDKETKLKMADAAESTEQGFSASKRLMDSKHAVVKKANELRGRVYGAWKSHTIPFNAFGNSDDRRPEPGVRLMEAAKYDAFHDLMTSFRPEVAAMQDEVNKALPDIKEMDRARLGKTFRDDDYPARVLLSFTWGPVEVSVPSVLEKLAPRAYREATQELSDRIEATTELAQQTLLQEMLAMVEAWVTALSPVVRIYPKEGNQFYRFHGAELLEISTETEDPQLEAGMRKAFIRYPTGKGRATETAWIGPMTPVEFADLNRSNSINEKKVFRDSTIEGMGHFLAQFRNVKGMIGDKPELDTLVRQIESHMGRLPSAKEVARELRDSSVFRDDTHKMMTTLQKQVVHQLEIVRRPTRRVTRIHPEA